MNIDAAEFKAKCLKLIDDVVATRRPLLITKRGKPVAVIGGQRVALGELYGDAKVVRISEKEVVLEGPEGREVLELVPDVEKRPATRAKSGSSARADRR